MAAAPRPALSLLPGTRCPNGFCSADGSSKTPQERFAKESVSKSFFSKNPKPGFF
jgi:hypothetical protein